MTQTLLDRVLAVPWLPSLPGVVEQLVAQCRGDGATLAQLAETIRLDPVMGLSLIRAANSGQFAPNARADTITQAANLLGLRIVRMQALGVCHADDYTSSAGPMDPRRLWARSLYASFAAQCLGDTLDLNDRESLVLTALFQDVGMIAMLAELRDEYAEMLSGIGADHAGLVEQEQRRFGLSHEQAGQSVLTQWGLPDVMVTAIRHRTLPERAPASARSRAYLLAFANRLADVLLCRDAAAATAGCVELAGKWFRLNASAVPRMIVQTRAQAANVEHLFTGVYRAAPLLTAAKQRLMELSLQTHEHAAELKKQKQLIQDQANHDQLTAVANRRSFTAALNRHFQHTMRTGRPVSLISLDCDYFKRVNDTYGHLSGDETLKALTRILIDNTRKDAIVARVGGEELAVVLPGADDAEAASVAERLRAAVETTEIRSVDGQEIRVTASFGVATHVQNGPFTVPYDLVQAADEAVYAAKRNGRNRVEVWQVSAPAVLSESGGAEERRVRSEE